MVAGSAELNSLLINLLKFLSIHLYHSEEHRHKHSCQHNGRCDKNNRPNVHNTQTKKAGNCEELFTQRIICAYLFLNLAFVKCLFQRGAPMS
ncbi:hypothetical protein FRX31_023337, partial [Thalictrum thalictroides]